MDDEETYPDIEYPSDDDALIVPMREYVKAYLSLEKALTDLFFLVKNRWETVDEFDGSTKKVRGLIESTMPDPIFGQMKLARKYYRQPITLSMTAETVDAISEARKNRKANENKVIGLIIRIRKNYGSDKVDPLVQKKRARKEAREVEAEFQAAEQAERPQRPQRNPTMGERVFLECQAARREESKTRDAEEIRDLEEPQRTPYQNMGSGKQRALDLSTERLLENIAKDMAPETRPNYLVYDPYNTVGLVFAKAGFAVTTGEDTVPTYNILAAAPIPAKALDLLIQAYAARQAFCLLLPIGLLSRTRASRLFFANGIKVCITGVTKDYAWFLYDPTLYPPRVTVVRWTVDIEESDDVIINDPEI
jgi:hypothetical protein